MKLESKLTKVTFDTMRWGVLGVLMPPVPGGSVFTDVWDTIRVFFGMEAGEREGGS